MHLYLKQMHEQPCDRTAEKIGIAETCHTLFEGFELSGSEEAMK